MGGIGTGIVRVSKVKANQAMRRLAVLFAVAPCLAGAGVYNIDAGRATEQRGAVTFGFEVSGELGTLTGIEVRISISHAHTSDLGVTLRNQSLILEQGEGANFQDTYLTASLSNPLVGAAGTENPFASSEWGGRSYRALGNLDTWNGTDPNQFYWITVFDSGSDDTGYVYKNGDAAPWGTAIGTQLIIHTSVPEPGTWAALGLGAFWLARARRSARSAAR